MQTRIATLVIGAIFALMYSVPAHAFWYNVCGDKNLRLQSNSHGIYASANSFPTGYWRDGLQNSINQFNKNPSNFYYNLFTDTNGLGLGNGQSETWGTTDQAILKNAPARAFSYYQCYYNPFSGYVAYMTEGDVVFDYTQTAANPFEWTATRTRGILSAGGAYGGSLRLLQGTAIHEFGHAIGLLHENRWYNVMGWDFNHLHTNSTTTNAYIGEDTGSGAVLLYGLWAGGPNDVAVTHFKYLGTDGEYSSHQTTKFTTSSGGGLSTLNINGMTGYFVQRGQQIRAEFTFENNGRATVNNVPIWFVISNNDNITKTDRRILTTSANLSRNTVSTWYWTVTIPNNLVVGNTYHLGVLINPQATISENDRSNNGTFWPIRIY